MFITGIGCVLFLKLSGDPNPFLGPPGIRGLLSLRGTVGFGGIATQYYALRYLHMADVTTIFFLVPLLTGIAAALILREPYTKYEALAAVVSLIGVLFVAKPSILFGETGAPLLHDGLPVTEHERLRAVAICLIGCLGATGAYLTIRHIGKRANAAHSVLYFSYFCCIASTTLAIFIPSQRPVMPQTRLFWICLLAIGTLGCGAQALLTLGLQKEKAGRATMAVYISLPGSIVLDFFLFDSLPDVWSWLGSFIIIGAAVGTLFLKDKTATSTAKYQQVPDTPLNNVQEADESLENSRAPSIDVPHSPVHALAR